MNASAAHLPELLAPRFERRELSLWVAAALLVVAAHAVALFAASRSQDPEPYLDESPPAVMLELAPMLVAPEAVPEQVAELVDSSASAEPVTEPVEQAEAVPPPDTVPLAEPDPVDTVVERIVPDAEEAPVETPETAKAEPLDEPEEIVPETATAEPAETPPAAVAAETAAAEPVEAVRPEEVEEVVPALMEAPLPEVAMAVPEPRPERVEPVEEAKPEPKKEAKPTKKAAPRATKQPAPAASAPSRKSAEDAPKAASPKAQGATGKSVSPARWQSRVNAHLNRHKRFPRGASTNGVVTVRFTINPSGAVQSVSVARSSGDPALDSAAVDMVNRASPVPAPPPEIAKPRMSLTVPVRFSRR
ncbi:MAG: TonB family protein [Rhizobiaceae bacterium]|nr:TonB family protein [Rhizobiaceae bacterium]